jgi:AraC-like DNA-binding protein
MTDSESEGFLVASGSPFRFALGRVVVATAHALPLVTASIERLRMEAARRLLSETRTPVKRIAQRCGFGSEETMRRSFLRLLSVTPPRLPPSICVLSVASVTRPRSARPAHSARATGRHCG